jgi:hypothetical protein
MHDTLKSIFQTLSENAEENFIKNKNAEDYLAEDGLWHCGKCGTAKQFRLPERVPVSLQRKNGKMRNNSLHLSSDKTRKSPIFPNIICQLIWQW